MIDDELIQVGSPEYRRLSLAMLMAGLSTFSILYSVQPLLPVFSSQFSVTAETASLAVSSATGLMAIGILGAGWLSDALGRRRLI